MDLLLQSPQCAFALCVLSFSHVSICAFVGLCVRVCLFLCSYTSVVINVVYLIGLSPPPVLWAVMKLNTVHFIFERSLSKHILSSVLQLVLSCINRALSGNCSLFVSGALILSFFLIFFPLVCLFVCLFKLLLHFSLSLTLSGTQIWMHLAVVFFRNSVCVFSPSQTFLLAPTSTVCKYMHVCTTHGDMQSG